MRCYCLLRMLKSRNLIRTAKPKVADVDLFRYVTRNFSRLPANILEQSAKSRNKLNASVMSRLPRHIFSTGTFFRTRNFLQLQQTRGFANRGFNTRLSEKHKSVALYTLSLVILVGGGSYAAVPLYRLYCQASGYGGTVKVTEVGEKIEKMEKQRHRLLTVKFNADKSATMQWAFKPQQTEIKIVPGETALAFYTARNPTDQPITGVSTYNVIPFEAGQYFNKIQCFCFEEQRLNPGEEVDMPVFFYIDPEFTEDPSLRKVTELTLSYTFFEAKDGSWPDLSVPPGMIKHSKR